MLFVRTRDGEGGQVVSPHARFKRKNRRSHCVCESHPAGASTGRCWLVAARAAHTDPHTPQWSAPAQTVTQITRRRAGPTRTRTRHGGRRGVARASLEFLEVTCWRSTRQESSPDIRRLRTSLAGDRYHNAHTSSTGHGTADLGGGVMTRLRSCASKRVPRWHSL